MKVAAAILLLVISATLNVHGQGTVVFNNNGSTAFRLWTNYGAPPQYMSGTNAYRIGLYGSTDLSAQASSLNLLLLATNAASPAFAGYFNGGTTVPISGLNSGTVIRFQVRFWTLGAGASWNEALVSATVDPLGVIMASSPFGSVTLGGNPVPFPGVLFGTEAGQILGFGPVPVPEPSFGALTILGALTGFCFLRRKRPTAR